MNRAPVRIERASPPDVPLILNFIRKLAEYERKAHEVVSTEENLRDALFGECPVAEAVLAYSGAEPAGFALYFETYSTFRGRRGIFLEDLFVEPRYRGQGVGTALLSETARLARERGGWLQWLVLDWNEPAVAFYRRLGATRIDEWNSYKLQGDALERLAAAAPAEPRA